MKCEQCKYWLGIEGDEKSTCRRYPPTVVVDRDGLPRTKWPQTNKCACCGEFEAKE